MFYNIFDNIMFFQNLEPVSNFVKIIVAIPNKITVAIILMYSIPIGSMTGSRKPLTAAKFMLGPIF